MLTLVQVFGVYVLGVFVSHHLRTRIPTPSITRPRIPAPTYPPPRINPSVICNEKHTK